MKIDIVIVNWNSGSQLKECIDSIIVHANDNISRIIVVDNGSNDGSADTVLYLPSVEVIRIGENLGFAAACNRGAKGCDSPYLLFLNPDTRVEPNSFHVPITFMEKPDNIGVGICGIQLVDESGQVSRTCARFPTLWRLVASVLGFDKLPNFKGSGLHMRDWDHCSSRKVDHVIGAFYLIRRSLFEAFEGFDERFFVYLEDVDLSYRVTQWGCDIWYLANAQAFHAGGGTSRQVKAKRLFYSIRSRLLYGFKHFPAWQAWLLLAVTVIVEPVTRTALCITHGDGAGVCQIWSAYRFLWSSMGRIVRGEGRWNP